MDVILKSVVIKDNGLRCFIPPCFMYDLQDNHGRVIQTVSEISISQNIVGTRLTPDAIIMEGKLVDGTLQEYTEESAEMKTLGLRFIITEIHNQ